MDKTYQPTRWTRADTLKINPNDLTTTQPVVPSNFKAMSNKVFIWDTMPIRDLEGEVVSVNGWSVIFTLTADRRPNEIKDKNGNYDITADWTSRHGRAYISYWYSATGKNWVYGGRVMAEGVSPTKAEWAGTPILTDTKGSIDLYYTCMGTDVTIAKVSGKIVTSATGVSLSGFTSVKSLFKADGTYYQTKAQYSGFNFRDPSPFIDPVSKQLCMVFEGNVAGKRGTHTVTQDDIGLVPPGTAAVPDAAKNRVGCIGLAVAKDSKGDSWELYPPLVTAVGVNDQTERPHYVFKDDKYYLFTISHKSTYAAGVTGPDGVYGFVSENLTGPYRPMNGSGLVLGNPPSQPLQTYSHCVMPNGLVTSFIDRVYAANGVDYRIGGTEAPTVKIELKGDRSFLIETLDYGYIPPTRNIIV